jgi:hypothetical protein
MSDRLETPRPIGRRSLLLPVLLVLATTGTSIAQNPRYLIREDETGVQCLEVVS